MPAAGIAVGCAREGHTAEDQKIASTVQELLDSGPCLLREGRAVGKNQKASGGEDILKVVRTRGLSAGQHCGQLLRGRGCGIYRGKTGFTEHDYARLGKDCSLAHQKKRGGDCEESKFAH